MYKPPIESSYQILQITRKSKNKSIDYRRPQTDENQMNIMKTRSTILLQDNRHRVGSSATFP